jgi:beta-lactamase superfamily II metal-dependent hydrolase
MSIIKSFSVGDGDMFYIKHGSSNFTVIDCCLHDEDRDELIREINEEKKNKDIYRFISTHPDEDHIRQLDYFDDKTSIINFYCVKNSATKYDETPGFKRYKTLRDGDKAFYLKKGCKRKWMNQSGKDDNDKERGSAGINILWPDVNNERYKKALENAAAGVTPNNISCIIKYSLEGGVTAIWMGDLERDFMEEIVDEVSLPKTNLLFAPHHGRKSGKIPQKWIDAMDPDIIIMGEANSNDSDYASYPDHNKIRQNSAKEITFECEASKVHCYVSNPNYSVDFLDDEGANTFDYYIGTLNIPNA